MLWSDVVAGDGKRNVQICGKRCGLVELVRRAIYQNASRASSYGNQPSGLLSAACDWPPLPASSSPNQKNCPVRAAGSAEGANARSRKRKMPMPQWLTTCALSVGTAERMRRIRAVWQLCHYVLSLAPDQRPRTLDALARSTQTIRRVRSFTIQPGVLARELEAPSAVEKLLCMAGLPCPEKFIELPHADVLARERVAWNKLQGPTQLKMSTGAMARWMSSHAYVQCNYTVIDIMSVLCELGLASMSQEGSSIGLSELTLESCQRKLPRIPNQKLLWQSWNICRLSSKACMVTGIPHECMGRFIGKGGVAIKALTDSLLRVSSSAIGGVNVKLHWTLPERYAPAKPSERLALSLRCVGLFFAASSSRTQSAAEVALAAAGSRVKQHIAALRKGRKPPSLPLQLKDPAQRPTGGIQKPRRQNCQKSAHPRRSVHKPAREDICGEYELQKSRFGKKWQRKMRQWRSNKHMTRFSRRPVEDMYKGGRVKGSECFFGEDLVPSSRQPVSRCALRQGSTFVLKVHSSNVLPAHELITRGPQKACPSDEPATELSIPGLQPPYPGSQQTLATWIQLSGLIRNRRQLANCTATHDALLRSTVVIDGHEILRASPRNYEEQWNEAKKTLPRVPIQRGFVCTGPQFFKLERDLHNET